MKLTQIRLSGASARARQFRIAYTLVEMITSMGVFAFVLMGFVYSYLFGLRCDELTGSKMGASDASRLTFGLIANDIESSKIWRIGSGTASSFTPCNNGTNQIGNCVQLNPSTDTNIFVRYFFNTNACSLSRYDTITGRTKLVADHLTNTFTFVAEDYLGNAVTNLQYKYLIHVLLEFSQYQYPITKIGNGNYYDYYKIEFRVTPHCPDGA